MSYAIIQGGSKGIGFALARILHSRTTLNVLVTSRSKEIFDTSMASSGISDDRIKHLPMDITNSDSVKAAFASVKEDYGRNLALYVNSAGYLEPEKSLGQLSDYERINRHFAGMLSYSSYFLVNVMGPMHAASFFSKLYPSKPDPLSIFPPAWLNITGIQQQLITQHNSSCRINF
jgi:NAD(P)-dependent dehydrogenase (short-subunit alcohol dehydrogenase family)